jgi:hydrogenase/urease accessory protein HupE
MSLPSTVPARCGPPSRAISTALVVVIWLHPAPALAHGSLAVGDFYSGMLHPLLHFETLLPTLALALWSGQLGGPHSSRLPLAFLGAALLGTVAGILEIDLYLGPASLRLSMLVFGLLVAAQGKLPASLAMAMAFLFGLFEGQINTYDPETKIERPLLFIAGVGSSIGLILLETKIERPLLFIAGVGSSIGLILFHVVTRVVRYRAFWVQTGVRVLGSWIAATGLLVLALEWGADK